jgi:hypothetical protein
MASGFGLNEFMMGLIEPYANIEIILLFDTI